MTDRGGWERTPPEMLKGPLDGTGSLWAIVLAGGEGIRLRSLVREVCGDERPKQYVPLLDSRTLLQQTLDRVGRLVPAARTVIVTMQGHTRYLRGLLGAPIGPQVLAQPADRGTAAAVLLPAHWIQIAEGMGIRSILHTDYRSTFATLSSFGLQNA
jgi:mannose-1-phosphate guanylyltransferase